MLVVVVLNGGGGRWRMESAVSSVLGEVRMCAGEGVSGAGMTAGSRISSESHLAARNISGL